MGRSKRGPPYARGTPSTAQHAHKIRQPGREGTPAPCPEEACSCFCCRSLRKEEPGRATLPPPNSACQGGGVVRAGGLRASLPPCPALRPEAEPSTRTSHRRPSPPPSCSALRSGLSVRGCQLELGLRRPCGSRRSIETEEPPPPPRCCSCCSCGRPRWAPRPG